MVILIINSSKMVVMLTVVEATLAPFNSLQFGRFVYVLNVK
jgi:hypothetical protein